MEKNMENEIIQALKDDTFYDYIANNYYKIPREFMKDLLQEIYYFLRYADLDKEVNNIIISGLEKNRDWEV